MIKLEASKMTKAIEKAIEKAKAIHRVLSRWA